ncbi:MAG: hypothetical protein SAL70_22155 [Scytonema sp. PMC 1070.18]|nr:hypothetical protein [Scytonema sp. PMC 1070.18]
MNLPPIQVKADVAEANKSTFVKVFASDRQSSPLQSKIQQEIKQ